jgi:hypothetical protein
MYSTRRESMFLKSWVFIGGFLLINGYLVYIIARFCLAFIQTVVAPSKKNAETASGESEGSTSSPVASSGKYRVGIKFQKVELGDGGTQFHYDWKMIENRSGSMPSTDEKEALDRKIQCYCKNLGEDPNTAAGEHHLVQCFN